ncbi:MAG: TRAP transporter substrate-binding protein [Mogibacterium sp.]|nr:TRAP transporter substrate-binding protein [Mogibacterium sp.]
MKKVIVALLSLVMVFAMTACGGGGGSDSGGDQVTVLKIGHVEAEDRSVHKALLNMKDKIEEQTDGRISVEIYPNAELGGDEELCEQVAQGTIQMALPSTSVITAYDEKIGILDMPYLFKDAQAAFDALDGELGDQIDEWIADSGFVSLGYIYNGPRSTTNNLRPIYTPDDLAGMKMRVMNSPVFITMYETLGANPTPMSFSELYTGLQQNVVDGQENPPTLIYASKFQEVQKYLTMDAHVHNFLPILTNKAWLDSLSDEDRAIVEKCCEEFVTEQRETELKDNEDIVKKLEDEGMEVNYLTDEQQKAFVEKVQPMYDKYKAEWGEEIFDLAESYNK